MLAALHSHAVDVYMYSEKEKKILPYPNGGQGEVRYCNTASQRKIKRREAFDAISEACNGNLYTVTADIHDVFAPREGGKKMLGECKGPGQVIAFRCSRQKPSGYWRFSEADPNGVCRAVYLHENGKITLFSPDYDLAGARMVFSGPDIPKSAKERSIKISLQENNQSTFSVDALNGSETYEGKVYGTLSIPFSRFDSVLDRMDDNKRFTVTYRNKTLITIDWNYGRSAKEKLLECYVNNLLYR